MRIIFKTREFDRLFAIEYAYIFQKMAWVEYFEVLTHKQKEGHWLSNSLYEQLNIDRAKMKWANLEWKELLKEQTAGHVLT